MALLLIAPLAQADEPIRPWVEPRLARALADPSAADTEMRIQGAQRRGATRSGELRVVLEPPKGRGAESLPLAELRALGARVEARSRSFARISATPAVLRQIAELRGVRALRFPLRPIPVDGAGAIVSQSVGLTGASPLQALGITGTGVKVAVIDVGFIRLAEAKANGEIPPSAIEVDFTGAGMETNTAHGTAVAEQVADMAPGAQLFLILFDDEIGFENAAEYLSDNGIRIANLSVNWFGASYYDDTGPISDIVNRSHDVDGVFWAVGAGNWAFRHWRGAWSDSDSDGWQSFGADERLGLIAELSQICFVLNWNQYPEKYSGTVTNLDVFVYSSTNAVVASSQDPQGAGSLPVEQVCWPRMGSQEPYSIGVRRISGPTAQLDISLFSSQAAIGVSEQDPESSAADPVVAHGAFAVGAIDQALWLSADPGIENFSSRGPTTDGRPKPEIVAPNRTVSMAYGPSALGTSFASPVVAGAAALLAQQAPLITANQIRAALVGAAQDVGPPGRDDFFGYGKLVVSALALPIDSDGDGVSDFADPCPFTPSSACNCGDVDGSGVIAQADETVMRAFLADPAGPNPALTGPQLCNVFGAAAPFMLDCRVDDWVVMRRARAGRAPGIQPVCSPALPP